MLAVYKRELRSYFSSMIAYVFIAFVVAFIGLYFMDFNLSYGYPYFSYSLMSMMMILMFAIPILTMKSFSEERKNKTDQLLLTAPVTVTSIVLGKFFSMLTVYAVPLLISCFCPIIISTFDYSYLFGDYMAILSFLFMGGMLIAIGMFISSITENQLIAAVITFAVMLMLYMWDSLVKMIPSTEFASLIGMLIIALLIAGIAYSISKNRLISVCIGGVGIIVVMIFYFIDASAFAGLVPSILGSFSLRKIINNFTFYSVLDLGGLFFYISVSVLFIFLTVQNLQKRRWS